VGSLRFRGIGRLGAVLEEFHKERSTIRAQINGFGELAGEDPGRSLEDGSLVGD
jgi:hypothetical protein